MYYKTGIGEGRAARGLSSEQIERARKGFRAALWGRRFHPDFIARYCDELLAVAQIEYARTISKGKQVEEPITWMIHCAYRRAQNMLTVISAQPEMVSSDVLAEMVDEAAPTPDQIVEDEDRARKVRRAVAELSEDQQRLIALAYLEGMSVREAGRRLGWSPSKALRCERSALKRLRECLGVSSIDELQVEIGLAAWIMLSAGGALHLPAGIEGILDRAAHHAGDLWARVQDLARRLGPGGSDAAGALAASGGGRGLGACVAIAAVCVAGAGAVGPGFGAFSLLEGRPSDKPSRSASGLQVPVPRRAETVDASKGAAAPAEITAVKARSVLGARAVSRTPAPGRTAKRSAKAQVRQQTDAFARAASESAPTPSSEPAPVSSSPPRNSEAQAEQQFDPFN